MTSTTNTDTTDLPAGATDDPWYDIATAPRDGSPFLAAILVSNRVTKVSWWEMHVLWCHDETGLLSDDAHQGWELEDYSHWTRLPAPPFKAEG